MVTIAFPLLIILAFLVISIMYRRRHRHVMMLAILNKYGMAIVHHWNAARPVGERRRSGRAWQ